MPNWKDINPRVGAAYDLFGNGKTAIKASFGRYVVADAYTIARAVNPEFSTINTTTRTWNATTTFNPYNDCNLRNPLANGSCGPVAAPTFGTQVAPTTVYDPAITQGWGVRPYNWETQFSIQQQVAPRVSVYAGYTRRSFGNLFATKNTAVTNASYTPYCIGVPTAPSITGVPLPNAGGQQCGFFDLIRPTTQANVVQSAENFGGVEDVYDGYRLRRQRAARQGRHHVGRRELRPRAHQQLQPVERPVARVPERRGGRHRQRRHHSRAAHRGVLRRAPAVPAERQGAAGVPASGGVNASLTYQSVAGAQINAQYPLTNTTPGLTLGRAFSTVAPTVDLVAPGTMYLGRIYQTDIRFAKNFKVGATTIRPNLSVYNLFNANPTNTNAAYTARYGSAWLAPTVILTPRFMDFGVQIDF